MCTGSDIVDVVFVCILEFPLTRETLTVGISKQRGSLKPGTLSKETLAVEVPRTFRVVLLFRIVWLAAAGIFLEASRMPTSIGWIVSAGCTPRGSRRSSTRSQPAGSQFVSGSCFHLVCKGVKCCERRRGVKPPLDQPTADERCAEYERVLPSCCRDRRGRGARASNVNNSWVTLP